MLRVVSQFTGLPGLPGYCNMYFLGDGGPDAVLVHSRVREWWEFAVGGITTQMTITVDPEVREIDPADGSTVAVHTATIATIAGESVGEPLPSSSQLLVRLQTGTLRRNRVVRGHFGVPGITEGASNTTGGVASAVISSWSPELAALVDVGGDNDMVVWGRPLEARGAFPAAPGIAAPVISASVWDQWSVQRSRRP